MSRPKRQSSLKIRFLGGKKKCFYRLKYCHCNFCPLFREKVQKGDLEERGKVRDRGLKVVELVRLAEANHRWFNRQRGG